LKLNDVNNEASEMQDLKVFRYNLTSRWKVIQDIWVWTSRRRAKFSSRGLDLYNLTSYRWNLSHPLIKLEKKLN